MQIFQNHLKSKYMSHLHFYVRRSVVHNVTGIRSSKTYLLSSRLLSKMHYLFYTTKPVHVINDHHKLLFIIAPHALGPAWR